MTSENLSVFGNTNLQSYDLPDFFRMTTLATNAFTQSVEQFDVMPGGLTNKNFKITFPDNTKVAMRVAGKGTASYLNRPAEKYNATLMASIGIAPEIYFYDPKTGSQLCEFIEADTMHAVNFQQDRDVLARAAEIMRRYHDSGFEFISRFNPIEKLYTYISIQKEHNFTEMYEGFDEVIAKVDLLRQAYERNPPQLVPCHNDTLPENFMYDGKVMRVIDWEYGGMNDRYFDIGCVIVENPLDAETEAAFVKAYFGDNPTEEQLARVLLNKFLVNMHWSMWSLVQICYGKDHDFYWNYGLERIEYCLELMKDPNFDRSLDLLG